MLSRAFNNNRIFVKKNMLPASTKSFMFVGTARTSLTVDSTTAVSESSLFTKSSSSAARALEIMTNTKKNGTFAIFKDNTRDSFEIYARSTKTRVLF